VKIIDYAKNMKKSNKKKIAYLRKQKAKSLIPGERSFG